MTRTKTFLLSLLLFLAASENLLAAEGVLARGKQIYLENCAVCHGEKGDGQGPQAYRLQTKPQNFRLGLFKFRSTPSGALSLDTDLFRTLSRGVPGTAMIPQTYLSEDERWAIIQYLKDFSDRFIKENPPKPVPIPSVPSNLSSLVERGRQVYKDAGCAACHGEEGRGDGSAAKDLKDAWGHPAPPADLTRRPLKSGASPQDLYRTLVTGLDGTPMPSYQGVLSEEELWALVAYVDSLATPKRRVARGMTGMMGVGEEPLGRMIEMMNRMGMQGAGCMMQ